MVCALNGKALSGMAKRIHKTVVAAAPELMPKP